MLKKFLCLFVFFILNLSHCFCEDWTLAAKKFDFVQNKKRDVSEQEYATLIPQLFLEQIAEGILRTTSSEEMLDRTLNEYLVSRQSLFLQLSKEVKTRDSLVLVTDNPKKLKKLMADQEKKIKEVQDKIDENLEKTAAVKEEYRLKLESEKNVAKSDFNLFFNPFTNLFVKKTDTYLPDSADEKIKIYKNDPFALYDVKDSYLKSGPESRAFEKEMVGAKIRGFLDGKLTIYGSYFSVTCTLYLYPGKKILGTVTEVGSLKNCSEVVKNLVSYFGPLITNNTPVDLFFEIKPEEIKEKAKITLDGIYFDKVPEKISIDAGVHTIKVECEGYYSRMIKYDFNDYSEFVIQADMIEEKISHGTITMSNPVPGTVYAEGKFVSDIAFDSAGGPVEMKGEPIIGQFRSVEKGKKTVVETVKDKNGNEKEVEKETVGDNLSFFYYIPERLQMDDVNLAVRGKPLDHASYIDKRRIWTYRAYTLLVLSMPFTLFTMGQYNAAVRAYNNRSLNDLTEVNKWAQVKDIAFGVTMVCTTLFVVELVRYLVAANSVLPQNAHKASVKELENAKIKTRKYFSVENEVQAAPDENSEQFSDDEGQSSSAENESEIESVKE